LGKRLLWILLVLLTAGLVVRERQALLALTVGWSDFQRVGPLYFAPRIPAPLRRQLQSELESAQKRVRDFYGSLRARPTIIVADDSTLARFTNGSVAVTHYTPAGAVIVLVPAGQNVDVMAHELAHAELFARLGYRTIDWCVPTWFDEGLAVQFDQRPMYSEAAFAARRAAGWRLPALPTLSSKTAFFSGSREQVRFHYAGARSAVLGWLSGLDPAEAVQLIERLTCGEESQRVLTHITVPSN
jgi:hypothetical protein